MSLEAIKYDGSRLQVLNQLLLPEKTLYEDVNSVEEAWEAIRNMKVLSKTCKALSRPQPAPYSGLSRPPPNPVLDCRRGFVTMAK